MGGAITVDSTPGAGSVFRVRIPAQAVDKLSEPVPQARNPAGRVAGYRRTDGHGPLRVLIADDEPENREVLRYLLEPLGFAVEEAQGGTACLEKVSAFVPDLVLLDLRMPDLDGLAVAPALRELPAFRGTPIVAVSAAAFPEDCARALAAGCDAHLAKPVLLDTLAQTLGALLPLEWMRREASDESEGAPEFEKLSPERAEQLTGLVRTGSITAIRTLADDLAQEGCCPALARRIAALADDFDLDGLRRLTASGTS
jgi:CheY-like chemotaxis protein